jgi:ABC-type bacteriocin/lantibiotic exporter with double-glycine peptidase domain
MEEELNSRQRSTSFESIDTLIHKWKTGELKEVLDDWRWIFTYTLRYKWIVAYCLVLGVVSTTLGLVGSIASKYLIDIVTGYQTDKLWILIAVFVGSSLFGLTVGSVLSRVNAKLGIYINNDIQADIFDKIIDADWLALNKYSHGDVLNRFNGDISAVSSNAIGWIPSIIIAMYQFVATFCVIWYYDHVMALLAFVSAPFLLLASRTVIKKQREYGKKVRQMSSEMMTFEVETFYNFDTIKSFGVASLYGRKLRDWQQKFKKVSLDYNWFTIKTNIYLSVVGMLVGFLVFGYCLFRLWTHAITFGTMTLFMRQREALSGAFNRLIGIVPSFLNSSISAHRIRELVELPREVHVERSHKLDGYAREGLTIEMEGVDFAYREGHDVIRQSQMVARAGEIVALVGASGEGKTTLIRLILGLVYPQSGSVKLCSLDGTEVEMNAETRHLMS